MIKVVGAVAAALGHLARFLLLLARFWLVLLGPALIVYGAWLAWDPLGFMVAGAFLVLLDRRVS